MRNIIRYCAILIFYFFIIISAPKSPLIITIHGITHTIDNESGCDKNLWGNNIDDACECCLVQQQTLWGGKKSADEIVNICIKDKKICSEQSIESLKSTKKISRSSSEVLLETLYQDVVIRPMIFDTSLLQSNGQFSEISLPKFLAQAYQEKKLNNSDFSKEACLKAKSLGTQGGYNTLQLFLITSTCNTGPASMYIIKEAREGIDEATNLKEIEQLSQIKDIIAPKVKPGFPSIALPIAYFSYPDKQVIHYIAAMPSAKGKPLSDFILDYRNNQTEQNKAILSRAFEIVGKNTANFHKLSIVSVKGKILGKTMCHGDYHPYNIFFDPLTGIITFIDNETMAKSKLIKDRVSPAVDIVKLFFMPFSINDAYQQFRDLIKGIDLAIWHDISVKSFVRGYASVYSQNQQGQVLKELKNAFNDPFTIPWVDFNESQLQDIRKKYINPIFDNLMKNDKASNKKTNKK